MSLNLDKSTWKHVTLGDVAAASKEKVEPESGDVERFVAGEHMGTDDLKIHRWGEVGDGYLGPAFHRRFRPGQVLYGSRRTYLRKVAVADFDGVTANTTFVVETKDPALLLQELLPFIMTSEPFHAFAIQESRGSVNPYVNWSDIERYEFDLPPVDEQKRLGDLLWAIEGHRRSVVSAMAAGISARYAWLGTSIGSLVERKAVPFERVWARSPESGWSAAPVDEVTGHYVLSLAAISQFGYRAGRLKNVPDSSEVRAARLNRGDLLISRANTIEAVGRPCIFTEDRSDVSFPDTMMRLHLVDDVQPAFAEAVLASPHGRKHMRRNAAGSATSMVKINRQSLSRLMFPTATAEEQTKFLDKLARFDEAAELLQSDLLALETSRGTVLAEIFGGAK
ncbi:restriction endonuclease subunit S [Streptomyces sp. NPDC008061]|uniref:restriction endonuclease subunit S n=1 Tax=Streptomyces sp. NPDC008061 TaxID=3364805 RepID=UPI0036EF620E